MGLEQAVIPFKNLTLVFDSAKRNWFFGQLGAVESKS